MANEIFTKAMKDLLEYFLTIDDATLEYHLNNSSLGQKERVARLNDLEVWIYPRDHEPPHFHVKSKQQKLDAKFSIKDSKLLKGEVSTKQLKRIRAFSLSLKGKLLLQTIWNKYHSS